MEPRDTANENSMQQVIFDVSVRRPKVKQIKSYSDTSFIDPIFTTESAVDSFADFSYVPNDRLFEGFTFSVGGDGDVSYPTANVVPAPAPVVTRTTVNFAQESKEAENSGHKSLTEHYDLLQVIGKGSFGKVTCMNIGLMTGYPSSRSLHQRNSALKEIEQKYHRYFRT